jgi:hypothetical protein
MINIDKVQTSSWRWHTLDIAEQRRGDRGKYRDVSKAINIMYVLIGSIDARACPYHRMDLHQQPFFSFGLLIL